MAYEIPQQLEHKEKIMLGLTFGQLGWAVLFGIPAILILVQEGNIWVNASYSLGLILLALFFIFGDIPNWIKWGVKFLKQRNMNDQSSHISQIHGIKKIDNGIVHTDKELAIIEVQPINFHIKTDDERESIIIAFQKFLNSFDYPVQFVVTTQNMNLGEYLEMLKSRSKDKQLFSDFKKFIQEYISTTKMQNRKFYVIIPKETSLEIQTKVIAERLNNMGLLTRILKDEEIIKNLNLFFNGRVVEKTSGVEHISRLTGLQKVSVDMNTIKVNDKICRTICAVGYPRSVESGFLDKIISMKGDFDISIHIEPFNIQTMTVMLNQELQKQRADLYSEELKGSINPSLEIKYKDTRRILEELQKGEEKLFMVSLYITCKAEKEEDLALLVKKVESELNAGMILPHTPLFRQLDAYRSMMPLGNNVLGIRRNVPTKALSAFFPFTSPYLQTDMNGVMLGLNKNNIPVIRDIFSLSNPNGLVLATSGAGKSYFTKLLILRQIMNGTKVIVIDPQSEYLDLVSAYKGQVVTISRKSESIINPLDLMGHDFLEKRLSLMDLFKIMFGELTEIQKSILDRAITECYKKKHITVDQYVGRKPPTLSDLYKTLTAMSKKASSMEKITYSAIINRLYVYTSGVFNFLNKQTSIDFNSDFVCFNIGEMPKQVKPVVMFLILDYVYMKMKSSKDRKLLIIDEAWSLLSQASEASYIFEIVKTCRKYNMGMLLITQDVADLIESKAGHAVLANSAYSLLLRQKPAIINDVVKAFSLSPVEKEYLLSATQGSGILITDNDHTELSVVSSPKEHELITTNPNEVKSSEKKETVKTYEGDYYLESSLTDKQINDLFNQGYQFEKLSDIGKNHPRGYWVKTMAKESPEHAFVVALLKRECDKLKLSYETKATVDADLVITYKNKKYAFEIETGKGFSKHKKEKIVKFSGKHEVYGNKVYIILTDFNKRRHYERITSNPKQIYVRKDIPDLLLSLFVKHNKRR